MESTPKVADRDHYQMRKVPVNRVERRKQIRTTWHKCEACGKKFRNPHAMTLHERDSHGIDIPD